MSHDIENRIETSTQPQASPTEVVAPQREERRRGKLSLKTKIIAGLAGASVVGASVAGLVISNDSKAEPREQGQGNEQVDPNNGQNPGDISQPTSEPTTPELTPEQAISPEVQVQLDAWKAMDFETFLANTNDEQRALYTQSLYLDRIKEEAQFYFNYSQDEEDLYPEVVSPDNSGREAETISLVSQRAGVIIAATDGMEEGRKVISSLYQNGEIPQMIQEFLTYFENPIYDRIDGAVLASMAAMPRSLEGEVDNTYHEAVGVNGEKCWASDDGLNTQCAFPFTNQYGQPDFTWIRQ